MTHQEYLKRVGLEMKVARIRKSMTLVQVAKATGLHKTSIGMIESGANDAHILSYKRIADALGIELKDVL